MTMVLILGRHMGDFFIIERREQCMKLWTMLSPVPWILGVLLLWGCSSGLQEVAFMDQGRYIVSRSLVNDRVTAGQPHGQGLFVCRKKVSSEDMAELRKDGVEHSAYTDCQVATEYTLTNDQPVATLYKGPIEAAILGGAIGTGLALSGDTVTQQGGGASAKANANSKTTIKKRR